MMMEKLADEAIDLLKNLIATPSLSGQEDKTAAHLFDYLRSKGYDVQRHKNNVWARGKHTQAGKKTILLNSHHDTVKPNAGYTLPPYSPIERNGKLFGLGSNDAGASLVSLLATFLLLDAREQPYNLVFVASAEEENTGADGIESVLPLLGEVDLGVVGEPTEMQMAIAEKGLMVLDCAAVGKAGHAAREEGINAIILAMRDVNFIARHEFERVSELLGKVKMSVTQIEAGYQHNVVPDICRFVVDVRLNELYTHDEILAFLRQNLVSEITPRAIRLRPSFIPLSHPLVQRGIGLGRSYYGSPTLSDQALMPFTTIKIGVGDSARSHTADEFIYLREIREGIALYVKLLEGLVI